VVDDWISVTNAEAFGVVREVFEKDRLLISPSSAAVYASMKKYDVADGACVVGIFADDGRKFKSIYAEQGIMTRDEFDDALLHSEHLSDIAYM
jgi:cysteine synthase B